jgi:hypothetical protein
MSGKMKRRLWAIVGAAIAIALFGWLLGPWGPWGVHITPLPPEAVLFGDPDAQVRFHVGLVIKSHDGTTWTVRHLWIDGTRAENHEGEGPKR